MKSMTGSAMVCTVWRVNGRQVVSCQLSLKVSSLMGTWRKRNRRNRRQKFCPGALLQSQFKPARHARERRMIARSMIGRRRRSNWLSSLPGLFLLVAALEREMDGIRQLQE